MSVTEPNRARKGTCSTGSPLHPLENREGAPRSGGVNNPKATPLHIAVLPKPGGTRANSTGSKPKSA